LNYELFIAKRLIAKKRDKSSISSPIIKIAIVAIAIGMVVMIISMATGFGLQHKIKEKISGLNGHVIISNFNSNNALNTTNPISTNQDFYPEFKTVKGIKNVQTFASKSGIIRTATDFESIIFKGLGSDYDFSFFHDYLAEGDTLTFTDKTSYKVLISKTTSDRLKLKLDDKFTMIFRKENIKQNNPANVANTRTFVVSGIYNSGIIEFDKLHIIGDIRVVQRLNKWHSDEVGGFEIIINDFNNLKAKGQEIYKEIDQSLYAATIAEKNSGLFEWLGLFDMNIQLIIIIMIIITGINMITALLVLILERTQMIGILKSFGNSNRSIQKIFLYNAAYLILKGLFWGNLIGIGLVLIQNYFGIITLDPESYYVNKMPLYITTFHIFLLNLGTLLLCLLMLILPTFMVSKITPVKAIKFD
jgi:lipoprotein-releasing system permease protein